LSLSLNGRHKSMMNVRREQAAARPTARQFSVPTLSAWYYRPFRALLCCWKHHLSSRGLVYQRQGTSAPMSVRRPQIIGVVAGPSFKMTMCCCSLSGFSRVFPVDDNLAGCNHRGFNSVSLETTEHSADHQQWRKTRRVAGH